MLDPSSFRPRHAALSLLAGSLLLAVPAFAQCPGGYGGGGGSTEGSRGGSSSPSGPSGPSTPGPTGPTTPSPGGPGSPTAGPATGGGPGAPVAGPATGGFGGPAVGGPRGGMPLVFTHGETSKKMLQIAWDYPVYVPPEQEGSGTRAQPVRKALPLEEALQVVVKDDRRPLLVLRECYQCQGTDLALLSREFSNERTILLTSWFHCVKLPAHVSQADHPFHALFPEHSHLFLAKADGSGRLDFDGMQSQQKLWRVMRDLLRETYEGNAERSVRELLKLLAQFDIVDEKEARLLRELDEALETRGADSSKVRSLQSELKALAADRADLLAKEKELRDLQLKELEPAGK